MAAGQIVFVGILTVILTVFAVFLGTHFHEISHYIVARIWTNDVSIRYIYLIFPVSVEVPGIDEVPTWGIRTLGVAPQLFLFPVIGYLYLRFELPFTLLSFGFVPASVYSALLGGGLVTSPGDWIAVLFPDEFRKMADTDESFSHLENLRFLFDHIFSK
jgi:hypothetical protein